MLVQIVVEAVEEAADRSVVQAEHAQVILPSRVP